MTEPQEPFGATKPERPGGIFRVWEPTCELRLRMTCQGAARLQQKWCHSRSGREEWRDVPVMPEKASAS